MRKDEVQLAHEAFSVAQSLQPTLAIAWVGQAWVAERVGSAETLDLFRHAFELESHPASCLGYSYHVVANACPLPSEAQHQVQNQKKQKKK